MIFKKFINETVLYWNKYFEWVSVKIKSGELIPDSGRIIFPNIIIFTNCNGFYIAEFLGVSEKFQGFSIKEHKEKSISKYFNQFELDDAQPVFTLNGGNNRIVGMCLSRGNHPAEIEDRFPALKRNWSGIRGIGSGKGMLGFGEDMNSVLLQDCILINKKDEIFRCKYIPSTFVINSSIESRGLEEIFRGKEDREPVSMIFSLDEDYENSFIASQFQTMYLFPGMLELRIGDFIKLHPNIIKKAFNTDHFEYEPYLDWIEHDGTCSDTAINPDLLVKRNDGYYDIYDLKTALLNNLKITKKGRSRRGFIDIVNDGIQQLANYREYFQYPKNAAFAKEKYGIEVSNPKLVLIIGSWENCDPVEVKQAMRQYGGQCIEIIDYDTLCSMFRMA